MASFAKGAFAKGGSTSAQSPKVRDQQPAPAPADGTRPWPAAKGSIDGGDHPAKGGFGGFKPPTFDELDTDADGFVTAAEANAFADAQVTKHDGMIEMFFKKADTDSNGLLSFDGKTLGIYRKFWISASPCS